MGRPRNSARDEQIRALLAAGLPPKAIREQLGVSASTISRRLQDIRVLAVQSQRQYDRHQEQLVDIAQSLRACVQVPEPAFIRIEDLHSCSAYDIYWRIQWEMRGGRPFLCIPVGIRNSPCVFFGGQVEVFPHFRSHTKGAQLWTEFDRWSEKGGEYISQCWSRLVEIRQRVAAEIPPDIPMVRETSEQRNGVWIDTTPQICVLPMFWWTICSYPLRPGFDHGDVEYSISSVDRDGVCLVSLLCDRHNLCPNTIFRCPRNQVQELETIHQRLLKDYKLVDSLKSKHKQVMEIGEKISAHLHQYVVKEVVPGSCLLCSDWAKHQRIYGV